MNLGLSSLASVRSQYTEDPLETQEQSFSSPSRPAVSKRRQLVMLITPIVRLGSPFIVLVVLIVMLASQSSQHQSFLPVVEIDTSTMDMFSGMYAALGDSFTDSDDLGEGLSTSAILVMSNLTSILMGSLPDHTSSSFTKTCFSTTNHYRYANDDHPDAADASLISPYGVNQGNFNFTNVTVECQDTSLFDYRAILYDNGFYYMLSFADKDPVSDENYDQYQKNIDKKSNMINRVPAMLLFVLVSQALSIGITVYHAWLLKKNEFSVTVRVLEHGMAAWTLIVCIVDAVATISMTKIFIQIRGMAKADFQTFGVEVGLCMAWFTLLWLCLALCSLNMFAWVGPVWCSAPDEDLFDEENDTLLATRFRSDTIPSTLEDPFHGPFDSASEDFKAMQMQELYSTPRSKTPEMSYDSEFGASSTYEDGNENEIRHSRMRPII